MNQPVIRQVDYLDVLEQELLRSVAVCSIHGVLLQGPERLCCLCAPQALRLEAARRGRQAQAQASREKVGAP